LRVLLVEDHDMVAAGLQAVLDSEADLEVVGRASTGAEALALYSNLKPDCVVMDYGLPDTSGTEVATQIRVRDPKACVLMVTGHDYNETVVAQALEAGCAGFVSKERGVTELANAIRSASNGAAVFPADLLASVTRRAQGNGKHSPHLTAREREVLGLLAEGRSTDEIQQQLFLSQHTVRNHVRNVLNKLGARTKLEAVVMAARSGLVDLSPDR
jgi:DNA-binding NarL/FixJ family response regulator